MSDFNLFNLPANDQTEQLQWNEHLWAELGLPAPSNQGQLHGNIANQTGPYYSNHQQPVAVNPSTNASLRDAMTADNWFWDTEDSLTTQNGMQVYGTYRQLYEAHPNLQQHIMGLYQSINLSELDTAFDEQRIEQEAPLAHQDDIFAQFTNIDHPVEAESDGRDPPQLLLNAVDDVHAGTPLQTQAADHLSDGRRLVGSPVPDETPALQAQTPSIVATEADVEQSDEIEEDDMSGVPGATDDVQAVQMIPATKSTDTQHQLGPPTTLRQPAPNAPQYVRDITSPSEAHDIVDHPDAKDCQKLDIDGDDFEDVKANKLHFYAKRFFDAMLTPGIDNPAGHVLEAKSKEKFDKQQSSNLQKIQTLLKTRKQQKEARANCIIAFEAGVFVHEIGAPKDLYDRLMKNGARKSDRFAHLDVDSICSGRLEKMVQQVADYKVVAVDMLSGKKMHRLAYDPQYYSGQKIGYLMSNVIRQATTDELHAEKRKQKQEEMVAKRAAKAVTTRKRKRTAPTAEADSDLEPDAEDEEPYAEDDEPEAKRAKS